MDWTIVPFTAIETAQIFAQAVEIQAFESAAGFQVSKLRGLIIWLTGLSIAVWGTWAIYGRLEAFYAERITIKHLIIEIVAVMAITATMIGILIAGS